jgi:glycosyltransferase involved in cell wall biosynthesis
MKTIQTELVSIMMPAYNAENYIQTAIDSVIAQTYQDWELIIINDGSTDKTRELAEAYTDPRIRVFDQENGGESTARNNAISKMQGQWVAFLDADDLYLPDHLSLTIEYLLSHPERDAVYTDGLHIDQQGNRLKSLSSRRRGPFEGRIYEEVVRASDVFGPPMCTVLRRSIITDHNLKYDKRIVIGPDWDFFTKYSDFANFGYIDQKTCLYRVHTTNITVQVDLKKRAAYLAICRENAIKMESFNQCQSQTRVDVFYDLLVNLLPEFPTRQAEITQWNEFNALPTEEQSRLFRLMASKAILDGNFHTNIRKWLSHSRELDPTNQRSKWLYHLFKLNPYLCKMFLQTRNLISGSNQKITSPLADVSR